MKKTILITGSTDGIGLETARTLVTQGHRVLVHGRTPAKLNDVAETLASLSGGGSVEAFLADLSNMTQVEAFAKAVIEKHTRLDVLINNAGIYNSSDPITKEGFDIRFAVNTIAPYLLTQRLLPVINTTGRIINLSSAAQSAVDTEALAGKRALSAGAAYAQSKLALTMWSGRMGQLYKDSGPMIVAVNPGSLLATKMVKQAFGIAGNDVRIGADILIRAALSDEFADAAGLYFDNDARRFARPHADALNKEKTDAVVAAIEAVVAAMH